MTDPDPADRLWLALAVATLWVISTGDALEQDLAVPVIRDLPPRRTRVRAAPASSSSACSSSWPLP